MANSTVPTKATGDQVSAAEINNIVTAINSKQDTIASGNSAAVLTALGATATGTTLLKAANTAAVKTALAYVAAADVPTGSVRAGVLQGASEATVATADATDLASAQALANALKVTVNSLLAKLRTAGVIAP